MITVFTNGEELAKGTVLYTEESRFKDVDFFAWLMGVKSADIKPDPMPGMVGMRESVIERYHTNLEGFETYYAIYLADQTKDGYVPNLVFVTTQPLEPETELFDIAEAIVYSFAYSHE